MFCICLFAFTPRAIMPAYLLFILKRSIRLFLAVAKIMIPVMAIVQVAQAIGLVDLVGQLIAPAMGLLNLPPEAGIVWATTAFTGIYAGIAVLSALAGSFDLTSAQLSALAAMMLIAHGLPVEQAIVRRAGAGFLVTTALRVLTAVVYAATVGWVCQASGWLSEPVSLEWLTGSSLLSEPTDGIAGWLQTTAFSMAFTFIIITALVLTLDIFERIGITRRFTSAMMPVLKVSGLNEQVAPVTTVGVLLGLTYGGALIIEEAEKQQFSARTRFLALSWLSLSHSLIEDTLLLLALGADIWIILVGRVLITLLIVALLARITLHPWGGILLLKRGGAASGQPAT